MAVILLFLQRKTYMADDGRQVVLTEAEHLNVSHNDHLVVVLIEDGVVQQFCGQ